MIHRFPLRCWAVALAACAATAASAQAPATAPTPTATYRSTFEGYQPFGDQQVRAWKESNDNVGRIGGWREYAKEAQQAESKPAQAPASAPARPPGQMH